MSLLLQYLNTNFAKRENLQSISHDFNSNFGVNVRQEGDLFQFKYGQLAARWDQTITKECRGHIVRFTDNGWEFASRPFDKFFNLSEGHCPFFNDDIFHQNINSFSLAEKADGTCIQLWHDGERWRVSTLGTITTMPINDLNLTFEDLFHRTVSIYGSHSECLDINKTYILELCCDENRIVTKYKGNHAVLLGIRDRRDGSYAEIHSIEFEKLSDTIGGIRYPYFYSVSDLGLKTKDEVVAFVEKEQSNQKYGEYPEGFVIYQNAHPVAKVKNSTYIAHHSVGGGDIKHSMNNIIDVVFCGNLDDIYHVLSDRLKEFANDVLKKISKMEEEMNAAMALILQQKFETRRDFALFVNEKVSKSIRPYFFSHFESLSRGVMLETEHFEEWLKANYKKFDWKDTENEKYD